MDLILAMIDHFGGVPEIEPRVLHMLDEHVATWLHPFSQSSLKKKQTKPNIC